MVQWSFSNIPIRARGSMKAMGFAMISMRAMCKKDRFHCADFEAAPPLAKVRTRGQMRRSSVMILIAFPFARCL